MNRKNLTIIFICLLITYLFISNGFCGEDKDFYYRGIKAARAGQIDKAFSYFDLVLRNLSVSNRYTENALFATAEYYFSINADRDAKIAFRQVASDYPKSITALLSLGYLFNMAKAEGEQESLESIKKEIIGFKQVSLLFRDSEEFKYLSAMNKKYKAVYYIDKVEIYIDGELFQDVPF
jgi:tetratricopeptide (TPR) repeat protein